MSHTARLEYHLGYGYVKDVYVAHFRYVLKIVEDLGSFVVRPSGGDRIRRVSFWMNVTWPSRARRVNALVSVVSVTVMYRTESLCSYSM